MTVMWDFFYLSLACLPCILLYLCTLFITSLPNWIYCYSDILIWFMTSGPCIYFCPPESQCETLLQLFLMDISSCTSGTFRQWFTRTGLCTSLASWTGVHSFSFHCCSFCYCRPGSVSSVNKSFTFLPQLLDGIFSVSCISRRFVRCKFPIFVFMGLPLIAFSCITLWRVENVTA